MEGTHLRLLLLNWIFVKQPDHDNDNDCREDGEQSPDHFTYSLHVGDVDHRLAFGISSGIETGKTKQQGHERTGNSRSELLGHRT